ncbi:hypothetical protein JNJ66_02730 [Candidatus Saccharibacteria bacterium]|nr:hypothetical protein [Candidatus Saccharibacteria bacterium]
MSTDDPEAADITEDTTPPTPDDALLALAAAAAQAAAAYERALGRVRRRNRVLHWHLAAANRVRKLLSADLQRWQENTLRHIDAGGAAEKEVTRLLTAATAAGANVGLIDVQVDSLDKHHQNIRLFSLWALVRGNLYELLARQTHFWTPVQQQGSHTETALRLLMVSHQEIADLCRQRVQDGRAA